MKKLLLTLTLFSLVAISSLAWAARGQTPGTHQQMGAIQIATTTFTYGADSAAVMLTANSAIEAASVSIAKNPSQMSQAATGYGEVQVPLKTESQQGSNLASTDGVSSRQSASAATLNGLFLSAGTSAGATFFGAVQARSTYAKVAWAKQQFLATSLIGAHLTAN